MPPRHRQTRAGRGQHERQGHDEAALLDLISTQTVAAPWQALLQHLIFRERGVMLSPDDVETYEAILSQLCGLLSAADAHLAAAAASAIASLYNLQERRLYPALAVYIGPVGAVLGNPAAVAQMVATGPPFAVARLTLMTAESSIAEIRGDVKRMNDFAAALLPGLLPAVVLACKYTDQGNHTVWRKPEDAMLSVVICAELALAAAQLEPVAGSAASRHLDSPRLFQQALYLAEAAQVGVNTALKAAADSARQRDGARFTWLGAKLADGVSWALGLSHHLIQRHLSDDGTSPFTTAQADGVLAILAWGLAHLLIGVTFRGPGGEAGITQVLTSICHMLWLCTSDVLPAAVAHGSTDSTVAVTTAALKVLEAGVHEPVHTSTSSNSLLLVAARVVRRISSMVTVPAQLSVPNELLQRRVLPQLDTDHADWGQRPSLVALPSAWPPDGSEHQIVRELEATVLLADELAASLAGVVHYAFSSPLPAEVRLPNGSSLAGLIPMVDARIVKPIASYMIGESATTTRPRKVHINEGIGLPGQPYPGCPIGAEREVADAVLQLGEACAAALATPKPQLQQLLRAVQYRGDMTVFLEQLPWHATQAGAIVLAHLIKELQQLDATEDATFVDALWPRLHALLQPQAEGCGVDSAEVLRADAVNGFFMSTLATTMPAAMARRGDIALGLLDLLERLLQRRQLIKHLHHPEGWTHVWQACEHQLRTKVDRQLAAELEPAILRVSSAVQRAAQETAEDTPATGRVAGQPQQQHQRRPVTQQHREVSDSAAAEAAADRMAQLLLQEEDTQKQQQASRAARKK